jgi:DNA polymerase-3 subunit gamma/tau
LASQALAQDPAFCDPATSGPGHPADRNAALPTSPTSPAAPHPGPAQPAPSAPSPAGVLNHAAGFPAPIDEKAKRLADFFNGEVVELNDSSSNTERSEAA